MTSSLMVNVSLVGYMVAGLVYFIAALARRERIAWTAFAILAVAGLGANTAGIVLRAAETGHPPLMSLYETMLVFTWGLAAAAVVAHAVFKKAPVAGWCSGAAVLMLALAALGAGSEVRPLMPALKSNWVTVHVSAYMTGYGACAAAGIVDVLILIGLLRAGAESGAAAVSGKALDYDRVAHWLVALAYPLLTIGLITGAIWANRAWGRYWGWDPKETWSLVTWLAYGCYFHATVTFPALRWRPERERRTALLRSGLRLAALVVLLFTYVGLNLLPASSLHLYQ